MKINRFVSYFFIICLLAVHWMPISSLRAQEYEYDLGFINNEDVWLSEETLLIGDTVRLYARVHNFGSQDNTGYVTFYQGSVLIGESQVVTVLPGLTDEVWVDFEIPEEDFNILARIMGVYPLDENSNNNEAVTGMYYPEEEDIIIEPEDPDSDGDGIPDNLDEFLLDPENNPPDEEEQKNIFAPIDFSQINNNINTNNEIDFFQTNENKNVNTNFNLNINNINFPEGQDIENINAKNFLSLKNIWFDIILILVILIIVSFLYLAYKNRENEKVSLRNEIFTIKDKELSKESESPIIKDLEIEDIIPIKKQKNVKKKIKVKKISSKSPSSKKKIGINLLTDEQKTSKKKTIKKRNN